EAFPLCARVIGTRMKHKTTTVAAANPVLTNASFSNKTQFFYLLRIVCGGIIRTSFTKLKIGNGAKPLQRIFCCTGHPPRIESCSKKGGTPTCDIGGQFG